MSYLIDEEINILVTSDPLSGASNISTDGSRFTVKLDGGGINIPVDALNVNIIVESGTVWWSVPNIIQGINDTLYITGPTQANPLITQSVPLVIPQGLYDASGLNETVQNLLENAGYQYLDALLSKPIFTFTTDEATSRIITRFEYDTVEIDFTQPDTPRDILGYDASVYGPYVVVPFNQTAPNVAQFNTVNYFLLHSDLTDKGLRINNTYSQTLTQILIDVSPGSQIVYTPYNPARINADRLAGSKIDTFNVWLTDDKNRAVNTNGEYFTARIAIRWQHPHFLHEKAVKSISHMRR